jgi:hypothetical protein
VAWQSTTSTSSCESGSEQLSVTICHDQNQGHAVDARCRVNVQPGRCSSPRNVESW